MQGQVTGRARTLSMLLACPCQRAMRPDAQPTGSGIQVFSSPRNPAQGSKCLS